MRPSTAPCFEPANQVGVERRPATGPRRGAPTAAAARIAPVEGDEHQDKRFFEPVGALALAHERVAEQLLAEHVVASRHGDGSVAPLRGFEASDRDSFVGGCSRRNYIRGPAAEPDDAHAQILRVGVREPLLQFGDHRVRQ